MRRPFQVRRASNADHQRFSQSPLTRDANLRPYQSYLESVLHGRFEASHRDGLLSASMLAPVDGTWQLGYRLYDAPNGDCR